MNYSVAKVILGKHVVKKVRMICASWNPELVQLLNTFIIIILYITLLHYIITYYIIASSNDPFMFFSPLLCSQ